MTGTLRSCSILAVVPVIVVVLAGCAGSDAQSAASSQPSLSEGGMGEMSEGAMGMSMQELATETTNDMDITLAAAEPVTFEVFEGNEVITNAPEQDDNLHFMTVLAATDSGQRIPYASVQATVTAPDGTRVYDERLWPMISSMMGGHYGDNMALPVEGTYDVTLTIGTPQVARHADGYANQWTEPFTVETTFDWQGSS